MKWSSLTDRVRPVDDAHSGPGGADTWCASHVASVMSIGDEERALGPLSGKSQHVAVERHLEAADARGAGWGEAQLAVGP